MSSKSKNDQSLLYRGIYEFEDPSGTIMAAKVPYIGSIDLYDGTILIVRPSQHAVLVYKGQIADDFGPGTHTLKTENIPVLTKLANFRLGFKSPLRSEIWFFSRQIMTGRRWGTTAPVLWSPNGKTGAVPIRAFGQYSLRLRDPIRFFLALVGTRASFDITDVESYVQGQILEVLPTTLAKIANVQDLANKQDMISTDLETSIRKKLDATGIDVLDVHLMSVVPGDEYVRALETKAAMDEIGDPRRLLLYQAAQSLRDVGSQGSGEANPMHMMMGLMLGKHMMPTGDSEDVRPGKLIGEDSKSNEPIKKLQRAAKYCSSCGTGLLQADQKFCGTCGAKQ